MNESEYFDPPPPYTPTPVDDENPMDMFLNRCIAANRSIDTPNDGATQRVHNLLLFTLSMDYRCNTSAVLLAAEREHFTTINNLLNDLSSVQPTSAERQRLAPFFWTCLHNPCGNLRIPVEPVLSCIRRLSTCLEYKGSCSEILNSEGLRGLATKLWLDKQILIPAVAREGIQRQEMLRGVQAISDLYFFTLDGIGSYVPNRRGRKFRFQWKKMLEVSKSLEQLTLDAKLCVEEAVKRSDAGRLSQGEGLRDLVQDEILGALVGVDGP